MKTSYIRNAYPIEEQETIINWDEEKGTWHFFSNTPAHIKKWDKLVVPTRVLLTPDGQYVLMEGFITGNVSITKKRTPRGGNKHE